ncbi:MAG TPA: response regulator [Beijerinckiaceae bacterium]|nr:response regulator [Beijerinckiaceae bacterium]
MLIRTAPAFETGQAGELADGITFEPTFQESGFAMSPSAGIVIVVDDDAAVRNALRFALELEGFDVRTYESGREMLAEAAVASDGCLVVDQYMPEMTGIDLVDRVHERYPDVPAILITAKATDRLRLAAALSGIRKVLEKPLEGGALFDSINEALTAAPRTRRGDLRETP